MFGPQLHDAVGQAVFGEFLAQRLAGVSLVGVVRAAIGLDQLRSDLAVVDVGGGELVGAHDAPLAVDGDVELVAEVGLAAFLSPAGVGIAT